MSVTLKVDPREISRLTRRIEAVLEIANKPQLLLMQLAQGTIEQVQARIEYEKTAPDGSAWKEWSPNYAATRDAGDSLLIDSHEMADDFHKKVNRSQFMIWNETEYAAAQNYGRPEINLPAREFMGFSKENLDNINQWLSSVLLNGAGKGARVRQTTRKKLKGTRKR